MHHGGRLIVTAADLLLYGAGLQERVGEGSNRSTGVNTSHRTWGQSLTQPSYASLYFTVPKQSFSGFDLTLMSIILVSANVCV